MKAAVREPGGYATAMSKYVQKIFKESTRKRTKMICGSSAVWAGVGVRLGGLGAFWEGRIEARGFLRTIAGKS